MNFNSDQLKVGKEQKKKVHDLMMVAICVHAAMFAIESFTV